MSKALDRLGWAGMKPNKGRLLVGPAIWLIRPIGEELELQVSVNGKLYRQAVVKDDSVLLASTQKAVVKSLNSTWCLQAIPLVPAVKLLAFLECAMPSEFPAMDISDGNHDPIVFCHVAGKTSGRFDRWLIDGVVRQDPAAMPIRDFLRSQESFWLVRYLLSEFSDLKTVQALSDRYGLSLSHFRRMCRRVLGNNLKSELRQWRAVNAVLDVMGSDQCMTDIAMNHGYASSSHFSREIKTMFGMPPCRFRSMDKELE